MADLNWNDFLGGVASGGLTVNSVAGANLPSNYAPYAPTPQGFTSYAQGQTLLGAMDENTSTGGGGGGTGGTGNTSGGVPPIDWSKYQGWDPESAQQDWNATWQSKTGTTSGDSSYEDQMRNQINSGYESYFQNLDAMLGGLEGQKTAQEGIAQGSFNTSLTDLGLQKESNQIDLERQKTKTQQNQVSTLKDVSSNIRNLMQAGNTYLGAKGAGDSSAVNQYAYALTKEGSKQRGNVMSQSAGIMSEIGDREAKLNNVYMQEKNRLQGELNTKIGEIATWFSEAQNQLRQAKANGELSKSQDLQALTTNLYNTAVQQLTNLQSTFANRTSALESWAMSNSQNLAQLKQNMSGIAAYKAPNLSTQNISGTPTMDQAGNMSLRYGGFSGLSDDQKRLLGLA